MFLNNISIFLLVVSLSVFAHAAAQGYPAKTIRIIVPLAAGGPGDVLTRAMGQKWCATPA
jgi:tripartite-type tricarboxylate transporter receptor subunit TctC